MQTGYPNYRHNGFAGLIGIAHADITPPIGIYAKNWGAAVTEASTGIHRPLKLSCITFQSSKSDIPLVLISADFCVWRNSENGKALRSAVLKALNLSETHLMFCLSHTHSGPVLSTDDSHRQGGEHITAYLQFLQDMAINTAKKALDEADTAVLSWKYGICSLAKNRDLLNEKENRFLTGYNPSSEADDTLLVGRVTNLNHEIIGTIVNYACHPTTLAWENSLLSPDYVGAMRELVESQTAGPCLFLQGASGELAPAEQYTGNPATADKNGRELGYAVLSVLEGMLPPKQQYSFQGAVESGAPLAVWHYVPDEPSNIISAKTVSVTYKLKDLPSKSEIEAQYEQTSDNIIKERLWRKRAIRISLGNGDITQVPLWIWRLGDSYLIGQPNETYSEFQKELRRKFAPTALAIMNLVNGSAGYLPPKRFYKKNIYQVWQTPFSEGSLENLIRVAAESVETMINH